MWTPAARAELARESLPYATCLTDAEWTVVGSLLPGLMIPQDTAQEAEMALAPRRDQIVIVTVADHAAHYQE